MRSESEWQNVVDENFLKLSEGNVSELPKQKLIAALPTEFPTID